MNILDELFDKEAKLIPLEAKTYRYTMKSMVTQIIKNYSILTYLQILTKFRGVNPCLIEVEFTIYSGHVMMLV